MALAVLQADASQRFRSTLTGSRIRGQFEGQHYIFERRKRRDEVERLKYKSDMAATQEGPSILVQGRKLFVT